MFKVFGDRGRQWSLIQANASRRPARAPAATASASGPAATGLESHLPKSFRKTPRSSREEWEAACLRTLPDVEAKFGWEDETDDYKFKPGGRLGTVVAHLDKGKLGMDGTLQNPAASHFEFASDPTKSLADVEASAGELAGGVMRLHAKSRADGTRRVPVAETGFDIREGQRNQRVSTPRRFPQGRMQATYGVPLSKFHELLEMHPSRQVRRQTVQVAQAAVEALSRRCDGYPVADMENLKGFIQVLSYYMVTGWGEPTNHLSPKGRFPLMSRSDLHATYLKLLNEDERRLADVLLLSPDGKQDPLLAQVIGCKGDDRFFEHKYVDKNGTHHRGPTYGAWFHSIVKGRTRGGRHHTDLLSPPDGFPLHDADSEKNYGMGGMGVDKNNGLMLWEVRKRVGRDGRSLLNLNLRTRVKQEFEIAAGFNPALLEAAPEGVKYSEHELAWVNAGEKALHTLEDFHDSYASKSDRKQRKMLSKSRFEFLGPVRQEFERAGGAATYPKLGAAFAAFDAQVLEVGRNARRSRSQISDRALQRAERAMDGLIEAILNVDAVEKKEWTLPAEGGAAA